MRMKLAPILVGAGLVLGLATSYVPSAVADKSDTDLFKEAKKAFNVGEFAKAIELFKQAYELSEKPAYLYNIGYTYDELGDCKNSLFFYRRFDTIAGHDPDKPLSAATRADLDSRITKAEACVKADVTKPDGGKPDGGKPDGGKPDGGKPDGGNPDGGKPDGGKPDGGKPDGGEVEVPDECDEETEDCDEEPADTGYEVPHVISARLTGGLGLVGAGPLDVPPQLSIAFVAGYPLELNDLLTLELGVGFTYTPVPYEAGDMDGSASLTSFLGNVGMTYAVADRVTLHADVGLGILSFGGLNAGNPFTEGGADTTGALSMFNVRLAAVVEYLVTKNLSITATPLAFSFSPPKAGMREEISILTRLDFMLGVGYRM